MLFSLGRVILYCNVGWCIKGGEVNWNYQQWVIAEWLGLGSGTEIVPFSFLSMLKCDKQLGLTLLAR